MEAKDLISNIAKLEVEVVNYIKETDHWLFYWIDNKDVQDFVKEYPNEFEEMCHLYIYELSSLPVFDITFDEHPCGIDSIKSYANLSTFRDVVDAKWKEWNLNIKEKSISDKQEEIKFYKEKLEKAKEELRKLEEEK
jgi:hypothetical protein